MPLTPGLVVGAPLVLVDAQYPGLPERASRGCRSLSGALAKLAEVLSQSGPLAYVETDYFGGAGDQVAVVWSGGRRILKPRRATSGPINEALRLLGVDASGHGDEFDAVGLGRYRETGSWLKDARAL